MSSFKKKHGCDVPSAPMLNRPLQWWFISTQNWFNFCICLIIIWNHTGAYLGTPTHGFKFSLTLAIEPMDPILYSIISKIHGFTEPVEPVLNRLLCNKIQASIFPSVCLSICFVSEVSPEAPKGLIWKLEDKNQYTLFKPLEILQCFFRIFRPHFLYET